MNIFKNRPLALCCFVYLSVFISCFCFSAFLKLAISITALIIGILFFKKRLFVTVVSVVIILGCTTGYFYFDRYTAGASEIRESGVGEFEIVDIDYFDSSFAYVDGVDEQGYKIHYTLYDCPEIEVGDVIRAEIVYKQIEEADGFDTVRYYHSKNIWTEAEATDIEIVGHNDDFIRDAVSSVHDYCNTALKKYTNEDTCSVVSALSIGDRDELDDSLKRDFNRSGLSHMLAISGMHLSIIMGCIAVFAEMIHIDKRISSFVTVLLCLCFILVTGMSPSVLRAGTMFILMSMGNLFRRVSDSLTNLMLSATLIILFSPSSVFDTGLILSFTSTFGIIAVVGYYMRNSNFSEKNIWKRIVGYLFVSLLTTLSAQAFSFIPTLIFFDSISLTSTLSNLLVSPILSLLLFVIPLFVVVSKLGFLAPIVGFILDCITSALIKSVGFLSSLPNSLVNLNHPFVVCSYIAALMGFVLIFVIRKRFSYLFPYICWFITFSVLFMGYNLALADKCDVVLYSESGSDAVMMRNQEGCVYIDLGKGTRSSEQRAFDILKNDLYTNELDYWVITAYSDDIIKQANECMNEFYIRYICLPTPNDQYSEAASEELYYYAQNENVGVVYYEYDDSFCVNDLDICIFQPFLFENSNVYIPSASVRYGNREISYFGCGYFDYCDFQNKYDIIYIGECGTRREQKQSPGIIADMMFIAENNNIATMNFRGITYSFSDYDNSMKFRISR